MTLETIDPSLAGEGMRLDLQIFQIFGVSPSAVCDACINAHQDIMWIWEAIDEMVHVPRYMAWCVTNKEKDGNLVCDLTINALATFGRSRNQRTGYSSFRSRCTPEQKQIVLEFLLWCQTNLHWFDNEALARSIRQWQRE